MLYWDIYLEAPGLEFLSRSGNWYLGKSFMGFWGGTWDDLWEDTVLVVILDFLTPPTHPLRGPCGPLRDRVRVTFCRVTLWALVVEFMVEYMNCVLERALFVVDIIRLKTTPCFLRDRVRVTFCRVTLIIDVDHYLRPALDNRVLIADRVRDWEFSLKDVTASKDAVNTATVR